MFTGAGTTISMNVTKVPTDNFNNVEVVTWNTNLVFAGSKGRIIAYEISYDDISIENSEYILPKVKGEDRKVEGMFKMGDKTLLIVGGGEILPIEVIVTEIDNTHYRIDYKEGKAEKFTDNGYKAYPHCDDLTNPWVFRTYACTWEEGDNLVTRVIRIENEGEKTHIAMSPKSVYGERRRFHGIAGLGHSGYIVAAVGAPANNTEESAGPIMLRYVYINDEFKLTFGNWTSLPWRWTSGFFSIDNLHRHGAVICFTRESSQGIDCTGIDVNEDLTLSFGSTLRLNKGGAAIDVSRTKMMIVNNASLALLYADQNVGGSVVYQMMTFTNAGDLVKNGPPYVISHRAHLKRHVIGCARWDNYKAAIVEIIDNSVEKLALLHTVYVYPRPIGIAGKNMAGGNQIQFGGLWKVTNQKMKLQPGRMYYTNDRGLLVRGWPAGYAHYSFGIMYVRSREDGSLMNLHNQVGMAVSENEILIKWN